MPLFRGIFGGRTFHQTPKLETQCKFLLKTWFYQNASFEKLRSPIWAKMAQKWNPFAFRHPVRDAIFGKKWFLITFLPKQYPLATKSTIFDLNLPRPNFLTPGGKKKINIGLFSIYSCRGGQRRAQTSNLISQLRWSFEIQKRDIPEKLEPQKANLAFFRPVICLPPATGSRRAILDPPKNCAGLDPPSPLHNFGPFWKKRRLAGIGQNWRSFLTIFSREPKKSPYSDTFQDISWK